MNWSLVTTWKFFIQAHPLTSRVNNEVLKGGVTMKVHCKNRPVMVTKLKGYNQFQKVILT